MLPLILRDIPDSDLCDALSPYGYPVRSATRRPSDAGFWERACAAMIETLRR